MAVKLLLVLSLAVVAVSSAGLLETLLSWDLHETEGRSSAPQSECDCQTSGCYCCVDLNLTSSIDLGGAACVNITQKDSNVSLNLVYSDKPMHNATIKIDEAANKPTCMNLLSELAQLCAKFTTIKRHDSGHDGCLVIEPVFMRTPQATYPIGCFNFNQGVRQIQAEVFNENPVVVSDEEDDEGNLNTDEIIAAVSASAKEGIEWVSQWIDQNLNLRLNVTNNKGGPVESSARQEAINTLVTSRGGRSMLDAQPSHEERSEERFKQLLSAQDNIVRESARIGHSDGGRTTFVYAQAPENTHSQKEILPIVPRESRRGGRAYNIHQHINEV